MSKSLPAVPYVVLCFGGRDYSDTYVVDQALRQTWAALGHVFCVLDGLARGADSIAHNVATSLGLPTMRMPANWDRYGKAAGSMRNQWMLTYGRPDMGIEFPGGRGTADMNARLVSANIPVIRAVDLVPVRPVN